MCSLYRWYHCIFYGYKVIPSNVFYSFFATVIRQIDLKTFLGIRPLHKKVRSIVRPIKIVCRSTADRRQVTGRPSEMMSLYPIIDRSKMLQVTVLWKWKRAFVFYFLHSFSVFVIWYYIIFNLTWYFTHVNIVFNLSYCIKRQRLCSTC